jgi:hypothetical protein
MSDYMPNYEKAEPVAKLSDQALHVFNSAANLAKAIDKARAGVKTEEG